MLLADIPPYGSRRPASPAPAADDSDTAASAPAADLATAPSLDIAPEPAGLSREGGLAIAALGLVVAVVVAALILRRKRG